MTTEEPSPDQTETWEPDWDAVSRAYWRAVHSDHDSPVEAVITEYRHQQAAHGIVEVRREDLEAALIMADNGLDFRSNLRKDPDWRGRLYDVVVAATTDQDR